MAAGLVVVIPIGIRTPAFAAPYVAPTPQVDWVVPGSTVPPAAAAQAGALKSLAPAAPVWPAGGAGQVTLPAAGLAKTDATQVPGLPVTVQNATVAGAGGKTLTAQGTPGAVRVEVYDRTLTDRAGVRGLLLHVARTDTAADARAARVSVDYRAFRNAYGADWSNRLRLVQLPQCALSTPERPECARTVLPGANDSAAGVASATVTLAGRPAAVAGASRAPAESAGMLLALEAGVSGGAGDFTATSLQPSATWSAGSGSGEFSWNYPLRTPPGNGGPVPQLNFSYSSGSVDGRMAASNNQPGVIGEGFEMTTGFIERRYKTCSDDMGGPGANNTVKTGDLCWGTDNATLSLAGHAGELIKDGTTADRWHLRGDDGTYVQHRTGAGNGARNGEWWVVTTGDGTQYWFGGRPAANSTLTVPVFGNNTNEPCKATLFKDSSCTQAWRWNLDKVVDVSGNTMQLFYDKETNKYARNNTITDVPTYDRASFLTRIEYGTREGGTATAPMKVEFAPADRCLTSSCGTHNGTNWPDTPWDLSCTGTQCLISGPSFWTTKRVASITTSLWSGTGTTYNPVTTWTLTQSFRDPGDGTRGGLILERIAQKGFVRIETTVPDVWFDYVQLNNRVDPTLTPDHSPQMNWFRLAQVNTESGGRIEVSYSGQQCIPGTTMPNPNALQDNTLRCYPVRWTPPGYANTITDYFHKYVVTSVHEVDRVTPGNPTTVTDYEYVGLPAWHYSDEDGLIRNDEKTWSQWRGYSAVRTTTGAATGTVRQQTETRFFRGMHGDKLPTGTRTVSLAAIDMNADGDTTDPADVPAVNDDDWFAGMTRQQLTLNGPGGAEISSEAYEPWASTATASRTINNVTVSARFTGVQATHKRVTLDNGRAPRTTTQRTVFDAWGMGIESESTGDDAVTGDESCTLADYVRNTDISDASPWLTGLESRQRSFAVNCTRAKQPGLTDQQIVADKRTFYDGATVHGTAPTLGRVGLVQVLDTYVAGTPTWSTSSETLSYDPNGRATSIKDNRGNVTTTTYTANAAGQTVGNVVTLYNGWKTTTTVEPGFGEATKSVDLNNRVTEVEFDGLGRRTAVWGPGRDKASQSANTRYTYHVRNNAPSVIVTEKLAPNGGYVTTYELLDGLLRARQTQAPRGDGTAGAIVTDTFYDSAGRAWKTYASYLASVTPGLDLFVAAEEEDVPNRSEVSFDGAGRDVLSTMYVRNATGVPVVHSSTTTAYTGDRTDITPPAGSPAASIVTDVDGNVVQRRRYLGATPTPFTAGSYELTSYTYDDRGQIAVMIDPSGARWEWHYNAKGQLVTSLDPDKGGMTTTYYPSGDLESTLDDRGTKLWYEYDPMGRKTAQYKTSIAPANKLSEWAYDGAGAKGQMTKLTRYDGANAYSKETIAVTATYQPSIIRYTIPAGETGLAGTYLYQYTYRADGSPETTRLPDLDGATGLPAETVTSEYTALGQPKTLKTSIGTTTYVADTAYTGYGETGVLTLQNAGGSTVSLLTGYEQGTRRINQQLVSRQTGTTNTLADVRYDYDPAGKVSRISDQVSGDHQCFRADALQRLTDAWTPANGDCAVAPASAVLGGPAQYRTSWSYDTAGRRATQVQYGTAVGTRTTTSAYGTAAGKPHRLTGVTIQDNSGTTTRTYTYDEIGNLRSRPTGTATQDLLWTEQAGLASATEGGTSVTSYLYDAEGQRLVRRDPGGARTLYLPGQELKVSGSTKTTTRYYAHGGTTVATRSGSTVTWLAGDHQGTTNLTIDAVTQSCVIRRQDPYGNARGTATGTWPSSMDKGFVGGTVDGTGLTHLGAREYDPVLGRFISVDPVLDQTDPSQMDGYVYGRHNPVNWSDPDGTWVDGLNYIGSSYEVWRASNGAKYKVKLDHYIVCRMGGGQCSAINISTGEIGWYGVGLMGSYGWHYLIVLSVVVSKVLITPGTYGPYVPPKPKAKPKTPTPKPPPHCPRENPDQIRGKPRTCEFTDWDCLKHDTAAWWRGSKDDILETATVAGLVVCAIGTAGVCGAAGVAGFWINAGGRAMDFYAKVKAGEASTASLNDWLQFGASVAIDRVSMRIPALRVTHNDPLNTPLKVSWDGTFDVAKRSPGGLYGQPAWYAASAPGSYSPWQMGVPWTDPQEWDWMD